MSSVAKAAPLSQIGTTLYVKQGGTSVNCTGWATACDLQAALSIASSGDQVWVAKGTYIPTTPSGRFATFQLKTGVAIYGGFPVAGGTWGQRDWLANLTTLSGNIGPLSDSTDNSYHVVTGGGANGTAILDGFTISGGNANGVNPHLYGGGMYNNSSSPTLTNVTFSTNSAYSGGGMFNVSSSNPKLTNVTFSTNSASENGGGMDNWTSNPKLTNVTFSGNTANYGGGMYNYDSSPTLTNVTFSANPATKYGGGMDNTYNSSPILTNVTFSANPATNYGGGMVNEYNSNPTLTNVTFTKNSAPFGGGMYNSYSRPTLTNAIVWGNIPDQIINDTSVPIITYSDIQGWSGGTHNINLNPFLGELADNGGFTQTLALPSGSPAIDAGDPAVCTGTDQRGYPRPIDGDGIGSAVCDMGAYEFGSSADGFTLTVEVLGSGSVIKNPDKPGYYYGEVVTLTATADPGWTFSGWGGDASGTTNPLSVTMSSNKSITANFTQNQYSLTVSVSPSGMGSVSVSPVKTTYQYGDVVSLTPTAIAGWTFSSWSAGASGTNNPLSVTIQGNTSITANFTQDGYSLTLSVNPSGMGSVSVSPVKTTYQYGDVVSLTPTAIAGWTFSSWSGDASGTTNPLSVTMSSNKSITANFTQDEYSLAVAVEPTGSGTVNVDPVKTTYHYGDVVTLTPTANPGWTFSSWSGNATVTDNKVTITGDTTITATFTQNNYTLTVVVEPTGSGTVNVDPVKTTYHYGDVVTLTPTANSGWTFSSWSGNATVTDNKVTITSNTSVTANFTQNNYTLTVVVEPTGSGTVTKNPNQDTYSYGAQVTLTANANPGWTFTGLGSDASGTTNPLSVTMSSNKSITANFTQDEYSLVVTVDPEGKGSVSISPEQTTYHYEDVVTLTPTANSGWTFSSWSGNATVTDNKVTITSNASVTANFTQDEYSPTSKILPETGFSPRHVTELREQPVEKAYAGMDGLWLEIPRLNVLIPIVGVPQVDGEWNVSWLVNQAGWLHGSTFPTLSGNSVLTGHVWDALNLPGPFVGLNTLRYDDQVIIHAWGDEHIYKVRSVKRVLPSNVDAMMKHEESPWLTLVTCQGFDESTDSYRYRVLIRAVLIEVN